MKICIIAPNFLEPTAWMISAYKTAVNLAKIKDVEVVVLTSQTRGSKPFELIKGVKVYRSKTWYIPDPFNYSFTPFIFSDLGRIIKEENPDCFLINKYMFFPSLTAFQLRLRGKEYTVQTDTFPGYTWFSLSKFMNAIMWVYTRTIGLGILRMAKKVLLLHEGLVEPAKKLGLAKLGVVHNGVDFDRFRKARPARDIAAFRKNSTLITFVGRLDKVKGYHLALQLAEQLYHKYGSKVRFLFVCGNKYENRRKELQRKYPFIKFEGFRKDIPEVFAASDIHVLTSYSEGLPNSVMEAMAAGCATVASDVGGVRYIIEHGKEGLVFQRGNYPQLRKQTTKLITNQKLLQRIKEAGQKKIESKFNWKHISNKLLKELKS